MVAVPDRAAPVQALLFDLDGTLIDSMPLHEQAWVQWFAQHSLPFDDPAGFFAATAGRTIGEILADLMPERSADERARLGDEREELYRVMARTQLQLIPGALALIDAAAALGLPMAVCTAAPDANVAVAYQRFGLDKRMATTVNPDQGFRGKPHPDLFLEAARRLGVDPAHCVVFEDAPLGVEAARRAGMRAVAVTSTMPAAAFASFPNVLRTVSDLTDVHPGALAQA
jgi:HAD superfamily hydrolase (TIGR01509 family)